MKSPIVLDVYDDHGELIKRASDGTLPSWIHEASNPSLCPNDLFALVIPTATGPMRKFACNDKANTLLSLMYFRTTGNQLSPELRKTAAENLVRACSWYGITVPEYLRKMADVSGTNVAPYTPTPASQVDRKLQAQKGLQAIRPRPEGRKQAAMEMTAKYADDVGCRYPLESVADVQHAGRYMDKYASELEPRLRRRMAHNIYKRAAELHLPVAESVRSLVEVKIASPTSIRGHLDARMCFYGPDSPAFGLFKGLQEKIATLRPAVLAETIASIDEMYDGHHHWGSAIPDPWDVVFEKKAQVNASSYSYDLGTTIVSGTDLLRLARTGRKWLEDRFGSEFADQFEADPIGFFDHLPTPEKQVLANMAHDQDSPPYVMGRATASR